MFSVTTKVLGLRELGQNFAKFNSDMQTKVLRVSGRKGAEVIKQQAKLNVIRNKSVKSGDMLKAIDIRRAKRQSVGGFEWWMIGVFKVRGGVYVKNRANVRAGRVGKEYFVDPPEFYWKFVERGTVRMSAKPFLRPSVLQVRGQTIDVVKDELGNGIVRSTRYLAKHFK